MRISHIVRDPISLKYLNNWYDKKIDKTSASCALFNSTKSSISSRKKPRKTHVPTFPLNPFDYSISSIITTNPHFPQNKKALAQFKLPELSWVTINPVPTIVQFIKREINPSWNAPGDKKRWSMIKTAHNEKFSRIFKASKSTHERMCSWFLCYF